MNRRENEGIQNQSKIANKNIEEMQLDIGSVQELHRYDSILENLGFDNFKPIYICVTRKIRD